MPPPQGVSALVTERVGPSGGRASRLRGSPPAEPVR